MFCCCTQLKWQLYQEVRWSALALKPRLSMFLPESCCSNIAQSARALGVWLRNHFLSVFNISFSAKSKCACLRFIGVICILEKFLMKTLLITLQTEHSLAYYSKKFKSNFGQNILTEVLIDNHYKIICKPVRSECCSCRMAMLYFILAANRSDWNYAQILISSHGSKRWNQSNITSAILVSVWHISHSHWLTKSTKYLDETKKHISLRFLKTISGIERYQWTFP